MTKFPLLILIIIAASLLLASPAGSACPSGDPYCIDISPSSVTVDFANSTYLSFWLNTSVTDLPVYGYAWSMILPFFNFLGWWLFPIILFVFMTGIYLKTSEAGLTLISGLIASTVMGVFFPWEAKIIAGLVFALCLAGILVEAFYGRYT
jgi:hypothetical protein